MIKPEHDGTKDSLTSSELKLIGSAVAKLSDLLNVSQDKIESQNSANRLTEYVPASPIKTTKTKKIRK